MSDQDQDQPPPRDTHMVIVHHDDGGVQGTAFRVQEPEAVGGRLECTWEFALVELPPAPPPPVDDEGRPRRS